VIDQPGADVLPPPTSDHTQLSQVRVPLEDAASVFGSAHPPIVLQPKYAQRIRNDFLIASGVALAVGIVAAVVVDSFLYLSAAVGIAIVLVLMATARALLVRIPEGSVALLSRGGKYVGELAAGAHIVPPWVIVTYLVTTREIPYDVPVLEVPTRDNVRALLDIFLTFSIVDARRFVYGISAADYDRVLAAASKDSVRLMVRHVNAEDVPDLARQDSEDLRTALSSVVERYGVEIRRVVIMQARPHDDFLRSLEARQLAAVQRSEQAERQALALQVQADKNELARQDILARLARERDEQQQQIVIAETRRRVADLDVDTQTMRLEKLDAALRAHPLAAGWERRSAQLEVSRALAGNTRAVVQMGAMDDITRALVTRDIYRGPGSLNGDQGEPTAEMGPGTTVEGAGETSERPSSADVPDAWLHDQLVED
jgi:regulator of protease activity HflC (stomatin/prohibitin superfamily)